MNQGDLILEIFSAGTAGTDFDQVQVEGLVDLVGTDGFENSNLNVMLQFAAAIGQEFVILENDGTDSINGQFSNGQMISAMYDGQLFEFGIDYSGGDGNDIVLVNLVGVPEPAQMLVLIGMGVATAGRRRRRNRSVNVK